MNQNNIENKLKIKYQLQNKLYAEMKYDNLDNILILENEIFDLERKLRAANGEPYAVPLTFNIDLSGEPKLISDFNNSVLIFKLKNDSFSLLEFNTVEELRFGGLNDELFESHELKGSGLDVFGEYEIINSKWIADLKSKNMIHVSFNEKYWQSIRHFLIRTKAGEFSCIALTVSSKQYFNLSFKELKEKLITPFNF